MSMLVSRQWHGLPAWRAHAWGHICAMIRRLCGLLKLNLRCHCLALEMAHGLLDRWCSHSVDGTIPMAQRSDGMGSLCWVSPRFALVKHLLIITGTALGVAMKSFYSQKECYALYEKLSMPIGRLVYPPIATYDARQRLYSAMADLSLWAPTMTLGQPDGLTIVQAVLARCNAPPVGYVAAPKLLLAELVAGKPMEEALTTCVMNLARRYDIPMLPPTLSAIAKIKFPHPPAPATLRDQWWHPNLLRQQQEEERAATLCVLVCRCGLPHKIALKIWDMVAHNPVQF
jgi:hypothetical protein